MPNVNAIESRVSTGLDRPAPPGAAVKHFLRLWREGKRPDVFEFLSQHVAIGSAESIAILRADQRQRRREGERVEVESYFARMPELEHHDDHAIDLIYGEFLLRSEGGERPDVEEFATRFPKHAKALRLQVAFFEALDQGNRRDDSQGFEEESSEDENRSRYPRIPNYEILGELGSGGMGVVYLACQVGLKRRVALKTIRRDGRDNPEQYQRFQLEAQAAASLHHPNIVEIYETSEFDGCPYFSLEFVEGPDLASTIGGRPMSVRHAASIAVSLANAMEYAHGKGVIHRDLKPSNILLTTEGQPKIADFGLAKFHGKDADQTHSGTVIGSPCSMSPEQAAGKSREVKPSSDVYSLGAILYEMLTGRAPFLGESAPEILKKIQDEPPVPPSKLNAKVTRDLETICLKCLEKSPPRRYSSAQELADDLVRFMNHEPIRARRVALPEQLWRWFRRKTTLAVALVLAGLAIVCSIALLLSLVAYHAHSSKNLGAAYRAAERALRDVRAERRLVDRMTASLAYERGHALCEKGDVGQGMLWLVRGMKSAERAGDQNLNRAFRLDLSAWRSRILPLLACWEQQTPLTSGRYSPDGKFVATSSIDGVVQLRKSDTGERVGEPLVHPKRVIALAFRPDGRALLTGCDDGKARIWDLEKSSLKGRTLHHEQMISAVAFSADGRNVLTASYDNTARVWDLESGQPICTVRHDAQIASAVLSPDGNTIFTSSYDKTARLWDVKTGGLIGDPLMHSDWVWSVAFSPDGKTCATACFDRMVRLWDPATGRQLGPGLKHQHCVNAVAFSPDSKMVLAGCQDGTARLWKVADARPIGNVIRQSHAIMSVGFHRDGKTMLTSGQDGSVMIWGVGERPRNHAFRHDGFIRSVIFSPDGKAILSASQDKTARLWDSTTGEPLGPPLEHDASVEAIAFSPDGRTILTGSMDHTARLWNSATGEQIAPPIQHADYVRTVAFSPDGKVVLTGSEDSTARLSCALTGRIIGSVLQHDAPVKSVAFSPDGEMVLTGSVDGTARLWNAKTGAPVRAPLKHGGTVLAATFSPDGTAVLTGSEDMTARLWDVQTSEPIIPPLQHQGPVSVATFSPDGKTLITGGWDRVARLWNAKTGLPEAPPMSHDGLLRSLATSPDGEKILTGSYDRTAQLWDKSTSLPIGPAYRHESQVWFVVFSPDGSRVISGGQENSAHLWSIPEPLDDDIDRLDLSLQAATGMLLKDDGSVSLLKSSDWNARIHRLGPVAE